MTHERVSSLRSWQNARYGMFVHWGLYSAGNLDCWKMFNMGIPVSEYAKTLEPQFTGKNFDAESLVKFAKNAGFRYIVLGARHHEGYCLWNTATTNFSSVKMTPKRDFIAEYTQAARKAGLKVGIYFSLMDWRWQAYWDGPIKNPKNWKKLVDYVHMQVEELVTSYGRIDILWYDGAWGPPNDGWGFPHSEKKIAEIWRSEELNSMVRKHQPNILINSRSGLAEDYGTPEKVLTPESRPWELCETLGFFWGASTSDLDRKTPRTIIASLLGCVSYGGNMLLNVGLKRDGSLQTWQVDILKEVGDWIKKHKEGIYDCDGEKAIPINGPLPPWSTTRKNKYLYMFLLRYPGKSFAIGSQLHNYHLINAELIDTKTSLKIIHKPTQDVISGLPAKSPDKYACMIKIKVRDKTDKEVKSQGYIGLAEPNNINI